MDVQIVVTAELCVLNLLPQRAKRSNQILVTSLDTVGAVLRVAALVELVRVVCIVSLSCVHGAHNSTYLLRNA